MLQPMAPNLGRVAREHAMANWKGPPNSTKDVPITYVLE